jgi:hypothetical protein
MSNRVVSLPHGLSVNVAQPYADGHVLTAIEADKLNHVLADSVRTALTAKVKRLAGQAEEAGHAFDPSILADEFQTYADSYSFVVRQPRVAADPVLKEANKIAKEQVLAAIRKKGGNPSDYSAEQIAEYIAKVIQHKPEIMEEAARRVDSSRKMAGDLLSELFDEAAAAE